MSGKKYKGERNLTAPILREILRYEPESGKFFWIVSPTRSVKIGAVAGTTDTDHHGKTYVRIGIKNCVYRAHRLAWLYMTGEWPAEQVDHKDMDGTNNKWENLREATHAENQRNSKAFRNNTTGYKGVTYSKKQRKWVGQIIVNNKRIYLGCYVTPELAYAAYCEACEKYHADFGRTK